MSSRLCIESIPPLEKLVAEAHPADAATVASFASPHRRQEFLAWRAVARRIAGREAEIGYDEWGAPVIIGSPLHVAVSHSRTHVAVMVSDRPCAVDIESLSRNFDKVMHRYLSDDERALSQHPDFPAAAWCAKEALYKLYRRGGLNLLSDIRIVAVDFDKGEICGTILGSEPIVMRMSYHDGDIAVCVGTTDASR